MSDEPRPFPSITDAFAIEDTVYLEEVPGDTIAEIGSVDISADGELLITDRFLPRVRLYSADGRFRASQGRFGEGPFEYRRVFGAARDASGRVFVASQGVVGHTLLTASFEPDTLIPLESGYIFTLGVRSHRGGVLQQVGGADGTRRHAFRDSMGVGRFSVPAGPQRILEVPYWSSFARYFTASFGDTLVVANSLLYPIELFDEDGRAAGQFGTPPPTYRQVPELERGALATVTPGSQTSFLEELLGSFEVVTGLHVVRDRWLIVPHGRIAMPPPGPPFENVAESIDMYDLHSLEKVLEAVPLPEGARVLGGGPFLHILIGVPPERWTILRLRVRDRS